MDPYSAHCGVDFAPEWALRFGLPAPLCRGNYWSCDSPSADHGCDGRPVGFGPSHMMTTSLMSNRCLRLLSFVTLARKLSLRHHAT